MNLGRKVEVDSPEPPKVGPLVGVASCGIVAEGNALSGKVTFVVQKHEDVVGPAAQEQQVVPLSDRARGFMSRPVGLAQVILAPVALGIGLTVWNAIRSNADGWVGGVLVVVSFSVAVLTAGMLTITGLLDLADRRTVPGWLFGLDRELVVMAVMVDVALVAPLALSWSSSALTLAPFVVVAAALPWLVVVGVRQLVTRHTRG